MFYMSRISEVNIQMNCLVWDVLTDRNVNEARIKRVEGTRLRLRPKSKLTGGDGETSCLGIETKSTEL